MVIDYKILYFDVKYWFVSLFKEIWMKIKLWNFVNGLLVNVKNIFLKCKYFLNVDRGMN